MIVYSLKEANKQGFNVAYYVFLSLPLLICAFVELRCSIVGKLGTWELGNLGTWELWNLGTLERLNFGTLKLGDLLTWELWNFGTWELGNLGT